MKKHTDQGSLSSSDEVRGLYENSADAYNEMMDQEIQLPEYGSVLGELALSIEELDGSILDTSCGTGHMLELVARQIAPGRGLIGVDLSPKMVTISKARLGDAATIIESDMGELQLLEDGSCAAVISYFAIHHVSLEAFERCLAQWHRVLVAGGQLLLAAWEGEGAIEYGEFSDIVTRRYLESEIHDALVAAGFRPDTLRVKPIEEMGMDAVYVQASKNARSA